MDKPVELFAQLTTGADPGAWVYLAIAIMVAAITGFSPSEARLRTFSRDTPWIQCQTAGTVMLFAFVLYWFGLWAIAVATNPREGDADAAEWAASQTGTKYVTVLRSEQTSIASTGGERWDQGRMLQKSQVPYIEANSFGCSSFGTTVYGWSSGLWQGIVRGMITLKLSGLMKRPVRLEVAA